MGSVEAVLEVLERSGFERLPKPLTVVGNEFDFEAAVSGTNTSHDLVLVASNQVPARRLQRQVAGLARSLDLASSRRPVSLVHIGGVTATDRAELERYARVLPIASSAPGEGEVENALAVLLPLKLPNADLVHGSDPVNEVLGSLGPVKSTGEHFSLIRASADGPAAVREALRRFVNEGAGWTDEVEVDDA